MADYGEFVFDGVERIHFNRLNRTGWNDVSLTYQGQEVRAHDTHNFYMNFGVFAKLDAGLELEKFEKQRIVPIWQQDVDQAFSGFRQTYPKLWGKLTTHELDRVLLPEMQEKLKHEEAAIDDYRDMQIRDTDWSIYQESNDRKVHLSMAFDGLAGIVQEILPEVIDLRFLCE